MRKSLKSLVVVLVIFMACLVVFVFAQSYKATRESGRQEVRDSLETATLSTWKAPIPRPQWTTVRLCEERIVKVPVSGLEPERFKAQKIGVCRDSIVLTSDFNGALQ